MKTGLKPVWAGRNMRLDPFRLPQAVSYATRDEFGDVTFTIDQRGAVIRRMLEKSGLPATIVLPARAFRGVAARAMEDERRQRHGDARAAAQRSAAVGAAAGCRRSRRRRRRLARLGRGLPAADAADRSRRHCPHAGGIAWRRSRPLPAKDRRKRSSSQPRRPRFLARRKRGDLGLRLVIGGDEIIARE